MYITCEQCSTIFRLDEKRLKPTGSKVLCSQCGYLFIAWPIASTQPGKVAPLKKGPAVAPSQQPEDIFDQELDGIDLAELDSILERDRKVDSGLAGGHGDGSVDETDELDAADLDLDFESALALDAESPTGTEATAREDESDALDLDMDFDLEPAEQSGDVDTSAPDYLLQDDLDMDFELDSDSDLQADDREQTQEVDTGEIDPGENIEMILDDFEEALSKPEEVENDIFLPEEVVDEDLSLDLDLDLSEETPQPQVEDQELELSLDDGDLLAVDKEPAPDAATEPADDLPAALETIDDELDLTDLDGLMDEKELQAETPEADEQLSFLLDDGRESGSDIEPALSMEKEDIAETSAAVPEPGDDDLDLSGFDDLLAEDLGTEKPEPEELELSLDDGAEFGLDEETDVEPDKESEAATITPAADKQDDGLDLGELDSFLELDEEDGQADESEPEDLELSLDDDFDQASLDEPVLEMATEDKADGDLSGIEELEFELDAEFEDKPIAKAATKDELEDADEADEELDLSDIEKMLEDDTLVAESGTQAGDLDLNATGGAEKWVDEPGLEPDGELDLTEIEAAIDDADSSGDADIDDDQELELDLEPFEGLHEEQEDELDFKLEMEGNSASAEEQSIEDDTDEIDLSDIDLSIEEEKPEAEAEIINAGDIELEFQLEEEEDVPSVIDSAETLAGSKTTTIFEKTAVAAESNDALIEEAFAEPAAIEKAPEKPKRVPKKKKGAGKSLILILILALLGGGGYFGYDYANKHNIQIPFLSSAINYINDYINPKPKDPNGIAMLSTLEINSKFIENEKAGRIFIVTGKVLNGYSMPRQMIHLQGKLFTKGKMLAKTELSYAGTIISDSELASLDLNEIKQRLKTAGGQAAGLAVNPGQTSPFMVVFSELPEELDEFAIELLSSTEGQ